MTMMNAQIAHGTVETEVPPSSDADPGSSIYFRQDTIAGGKTFGIGLWVCEPMSFEETMDSDEALHVLEGEGTIELADGQVIDLRPGVVVSLYKGTATRWTITAPLKKLFVSVG